MARTTIPWGDGSGDNIYLDYPAASGDQTVAVSSDANTGAARNKVVTFSASGVTPVTLTVEQAAAALPDNYVRDGLVFHLDGINRGGIMGQWKSLVGNVIYTLPSSFTEESNAILTSGATGDISSAAYPSAATNIAKADGTIEVCCEVLQTGSGCLIAAQPGYLCFIVAGAGYTFSPSSGSNQWNVTKQTLFTASASLTRFAYNGVITGTLASNNWGGVSERIGNLGTSYGVKARIYSIRKYNRVLTADEALHNQYIDDTRFGLGLNLSDPLS